MVTTQGNRLGRDALGEPVLWSSRGQQVMMAWEQQYMCQCVDALRIRPSDCVLEIGFGLAYSASHVQRFQPARHTIIECDEQVLLRANTFALENGNSDRVEIVADTWQHALPLMQQQQQSPRFDCVFFDDYPLPELEDAAIAAARNPRRSRWHDFLDAVVPLVKPGGRITGYLARDVDLRRPDCHVVTTRVDVATAENCDYFPHKTALVPVITVVDPDADQDEAMSDMSTPMAKTAEQLRLQLAQIRDGLLVQDMDRLDADETDGRAPAQEDGAVVSTHYSDAASRHEFLSSLKQRAQNAKRSSGSH